MMSIGDSGSWKNLTIYIGVGGAWKQVTGAWIGVGGAWKSLTASPMTASASPSSISASGHSLAPTSTRLSVTTGSVTVSASGGSGSYAYAHSVAFSPGGSTDASGSCSANSPTSAATTYTGQSCNGINSPGTDNYIDTCTVTDTVTGATAIVSIPISLTNTFVGP